MLRRFWKSFRRDEQVALIVSSLVLLFCGGHEYLWRRRQLPAVPLFVQAPTQTRSGVAKGATTRRVLVDVAGAVRRPGVQQWETGARVSDAVQKAGGALPDGDVNAMNLAARLQDGQQIRVPVRGDVHGGTQSIVATPGSSSVGASAAGASGMASDGHLDTRKRAGKSGKSLFAGIVNVNTASAQQLEVLPGIGPATAGRIVESRVRQGRFRSLEDLDRVKGLGPKKLEALRGHVAF